MGEEIRKERLYNIWRCMVGRCHNEKWNNYYTKTYYWGRGITVCNEWRYDYHRFKAWALSNGYSNELSIDRIDPDGNYTPENCRWIPLAQNRAQAKNRGIGNRHGMTLSGRYSVVSVYFDRSNCKLELIRTVESGFSSYRDARIGLKRLEDKRKGNSNVIEYRIYNEESCKIPHCDSANVLDKRRKAQSDRRGGAGKRDSSLRSE